MARIDADRAWIERNVNQPAISYDWGESFDEMLRGNANPNGLVDEWRKVRERLVKRRSKHPVGSKMWKACEEAIGLVRLVNAMGLSGDLGDRRDWVPGHTILERAATIYEKRNGYINALVQALLRDAMDEAYVSERFES